MRRIWLRDVGVFEIIPNSGRGSCLFQAISQALTFSTGFHHSIRTTTVEHMTSPSWAHKLNQFPDFWKHKIITQWLRKERAHFKRRSKRLRKARRKHSLLPCCYHCVEMFIERNRERKYRKIKAFVQIKRYAAIHEREFKYIFRSFMSCRREPGTRFELEAAADRFRFHFDYLQMIPLSSDAGLTEDDIFNNNDPEIGKDNNDDNTESPQHPPQPSNATRTGNFGGDSFASRQPDTSLPETNPDGCVVTVKMAKYQFHSCRNKGCRFPRGLAFDHYYFLHSPRPPSNRRRQRGNFNMPPRDNYENGHWELLLPIYIKKNPVPLNQRIFGVSYEISDSARNYTRTRDGQRREMIDTVAKAIDVYIHRNPEIIPTEEDPDWPADEDDDFMGCASSLRHSLYDEQQERLINNTAEFYNGDLHLNTDLSFLTWGNESFGRRIVKRLKACVMRALTRKTSGVVSTDTEDDQQESS